MTPVEIEGFEVIFLQLEPFQKVAHEGHFGERKRHKSAAGIACYGAGSRQGKAVGTKEASKGGNSAAYQWLPS